MDNAFWDSIERTLKIESDSIRAVSEKCDYQVLENVIREFASCTGKVILTGCGTSGEAAKKIAHTLCCVECGAVFISPSEALHGGLGLFQKEDIAVLISKGGQTIELDNMLKVLKEKNIKIVSVTEGVESVLAQESDIFLQIPITREADDFNVLATSSTLCVIALFDAIAIEVGRMKKFSLKNFAVIHPGGAVGKQLSNRSSSPKETGC